jgi:hypothetical protein
MWTRMPRAALTRSPLGADGTALSAVRHAALSLPGVFASLRASGAFALTLTWWRKS